MIKRKPLYEQIVEELIARIKRGDYPPDSLLPSEKKLMEELQVSRNSLREAMKCLSAAGVVTSASGKGTFLAVDAVEKVSNSNTAVDLGDYNSVSEILEIRLIMEPATAALAAERASGHQIRSLKNLLNTLKDRIDGKSHWEEPGMAFHSLIAAMTGNNTLVRVLDSISESLYKSRQVLFRKFTLQEEVWEEHRLIYEAIRDRNVEGARSIMRIHIEHTRNMYQQ